jgi:hypothetical protein
MPHSGYQDILRLSAKEAEILVAALNDRENDEEGKKQRKSDRFPYHVPAGLQVDFRNAREHIGSFVVAPRNISIGGIAFLHGAFVYDNVECNISLRTRDGEIVVVEGRVARCRTIHGRIHEIGVAFEKPLEIDRFVDTSRPLTLPDRPEYSTVDVAGLARRLEDMAFRGAPLEEVRETVYALVKSVGRKRRESNTADDDVPEAVEVER